MKLDVYSVQIIIAKLKCFPVHQALLDHLLPTREAPRVIAILQMGAKGKNGVVNSHKVTLLKRAGGI